ncbi:MAG: SDR family NAD(P)-dependent oxidoreductase [Patescibacteria group bacterium]
MSHALILGGTSGLGLKIAWESHSRGITPMIAGRSVLDKEVAASLPPDTVPIWNDLAGHHGGAMIHPIRLEGCDYFFWVAGIFSRKPFSKTYDNEIGQMMDVHLNAPMRIIADLHREHLKNKNKKPYHLVVVASTSSWRLRENETLYCALKAAKAAFARNFSVEMARDLSGSKVTLVNPGGMKNPNFWKESGQNIDAFMDPKEVAKIIWDEVLNQTETFKELQIMRNSDGTPKLEYGPRMPEIPK